MGNERGKEKGKKSCGEIPKNLGEGNHLLPGTHLRLLRRIVFLVWGKKKEKKRGGEGQNWLTTGLLRSKALPNRSGLAARGNPGLREERKEDKRKENFLLFD